MPENTFRGRPSPTSSVSRSSLSDPSTASAATIRAMRRSTRAKSSIEIGASVTGAAGAAQDQPDRASERRILVRGGDLGLELARAAQLRVRPVGRRRGELAVEEAVDEGCRAAGDVDVLANQVAVDARDEVVRVEVDV